MDVIKEIDMKTAIIYVSVHHGNTKKLVDAIASKYEVDVIDATKITEKDLHSYDLIGFASGIYGFNFHQSILNFALANMPENKKVILLSSSAMNKDFSGSLVKIIKDKNSEVIGKFSCRGYNTFGPFKLVGGTSKGHPNNKDIELAVSFFDVIYNNLARV